MAEDPRPACPNDACQSPEIDVREVKLGETADHRLSAFICTECSTIIGIEQYRNAAPPTTHREERVTGRITALDPDDTELRCPSCNETIIPDQGSSYRVSPFTMHGSGSVPDWTGMELCPECGTILGTTTTPGGSYR